MTDEEKMERFINRKITPLQMIGETIGVLVILSVFALALFI